MVNWANLLSRAGDIFGTVLISFAFLACLVFSALGIYLIVHGNLVGLLVLVVFGLGAYATGPQLVSSLKQKAEYRYYSTPEQRRELKKANLDAQQYKKNFEATIEQLILEHAVEKASGEMLPPWFVRLLPVDLPTSEGHAYWTNGEGGYYWGRFLKYWKPLDLEQKKTYFKKYDLGAEWAERFYWASELFDTEYSIDDMDETEYEALFNELLPPTTGSPTARD